MITVGLGLLFVVYGVHPVHWGREEVKQWLKLCISEFSFTDVQVEKFAMNGKLGENAEFLVS